MSYTYPPKTDASYDRPSKNAASFSFETRQQIPINYLLKEDTFYLLLEDGGKIILDGNDSGWGYQLKN